MGSNIGQEKLCASFWMVFVISLLVVCGPFEGERNRNIGMP